MNISHAFFLVVLVEIILSSQVASARSVQFLSTEEMTKRADVVAILEPLENKLSDAKTDFGGNWSWDPARFQGVATTFKVNVCFKGTLPDTFVFTHFIYRMGVEYPDGADFITFLTGPLKYRNDVLRGDKTVVSETYFQAKPLWLAFLKKTPDGSFVPVSGQYDAATSFKEIHDATFFRGSEFFDH